MTVSGELYRYEDEPILLESAVLYADLMGVGEMARSERSQEFLRTVEAAVREVVDEWEGQSEFEYATFSDSLLIAQPIVNGRFEVALRSVIAAAAVLQATMISHGILTRGGITIGDFSAQKHLVWGEALVRAAKDLEGGAAKNPRILIDKENERVRRVLGTASFARPDGNLVLTDKDDDWPFVNYFEGGIDYKWMDDEQVARYLTAHHDLLIEKLGDPALTDYVRSKLEWVALRELAAWRRCLRFHTKSTAIALAAAFIPDPHPPPGHEVWLEIIGPKAADEFQGGVLIGQLEKD